MLGGILKRNDWRLMSMNMVVFRVVSIHGTEVA